MSFEASGYGDAYDPEILSNMILLVDTKNTSLPG